MAGVAWAIIRAYRVDMPIDGQIHDNTATAGEDILKANVTPFQQASRKVACNSRDDPDRPISDPRER